MNKISSKTTARSLIYIRSLEGLIKAKRHLISSRQLSQLTGFTDVQIRKDISGFGKVGTPRVGYNTLELKQVLEDSILQKNIVKAALFGVGNLGTAILKYPGFQNQTIQIVAAFDSDKTKMGKLINGIKICEPSSAPKMIPKKGAQIGIIAVPSDEAQKIADIMVFSGLKGIANFTPSAVSVPCNIQVRNIDFSIEFLALFSEILRCDDCILK
jgi:redox-sensing transcriptional repressor